MSNARKWGCLDGVTVEAEVMRVYDGDTIHVCAAVGEAGGMYDVKCRLSGIDAPELRGATREAGLAARDALFALLEASANRVTCAFGKNDKYGRPLARIVDSRGECVNEAMIRLGHAKAYDGGARG